MKSTFHFVAWASALAAASACLLHAQQISPGSGRVLILDNERTLSGEIERRGNLFVIRQANGEMTIPVSKVLTVCASLEDAFKLLSSRANLRDGDERLRLARSCQVHGLSEQATIEVKAALHLRPGNTEAKQLLAMLQRTAAVSAVQPLPEAPPPTAEPSHLEVTGDCLALFTTKVQPILLNTCGSCHASGNGGHFVMTRLNDVAGRRATQLNLAAAIKQISFAQPGASPLLHKACSAHGDAIQAALPNRQAPAFTTLQGWVELVAARNPHLKLHGAPALAAGSLPPVTQEVGVVPVARTLTTNNPQLSLTTATGDSPVPRPVPAELFLSGDAAGQPVPRAIAFESSAASAAANAPRPLSSTPVDPWQPTSEFDPMIFNRMWHTPH